MTDEKTSNPIEDLRNEFMEQFRSMKESFENGLKEKDETIEALKAHNQELERALIRSAVHPQPTPEKTEAEIYKERVDAIAEKTLKLMEK